MQIIFNFLSLSLSPIFSIINSQWKLFLHIPMKLISKKTQKKWHSLRPEMVNSLSLNIGYFYQNHEN